MESLFRVRASGGGSVAAPGIDLAELRRAIYLLLDTEAGVQLQALPSGRWLNLPAGDEAALCDAVRMLSEDAAGVYYSLNPVASGLTHPIRVGDVLRRRWLLVDIDRGKSEADKNLSATEAEREDVRQLAFDVLEYLGDLGWPAPVQVDSGNGCHLLYRIDLPNDAESKALVKAVLKSLAARYEDRVSEIDVKCSNANRIARLPGTWSRKGPNTSDRPHRLAKILHAPEQPVVVPVELLKAITQPKEQQQQHSDSFKARIPVGGESAYGRAAIERECGRVALAPAGSRNDTLFKAAISLFQLVAGGVLDSREVADQLYIAACRAGLDQDTGGEAAILATIASGRERGLKEPRGVPERNGASAKPAGPKAEIPAGEGVTIRASEVTPKKVEWLWPGIIPLGKLTTFAGPGGLGKTFALIDLAARVSRGMPWPDGAAGTQPGQVLYISGEDDPDDTLVPRLITAGADLRHISFFTPKVLGQFTLAERPLLDRALECMGGATVMVCIDPPTSYLAGINDHKNAELRSLLTPLAEWAARRRLAVVFISHVSKPQGRVDAAMRVIGSVAWVNAVRSAYMFAKDPDDPARRLFCPMKTNLGPERKAIAYRLAEVPGDAYGQAKVEWLGEVDITADEAVNKESPQDKKKSRGAKAAEWLVGKFREKQEWYSKDLFRDADADGISRKAVFEAKDLLDLPNARKITLANGNDVWVWWVPPDWAGFGPAAAEEGGENENPF